MHKDDKVSLYKGIGDLISGHEACSVVDDFLPAREEAVRLAEGARKVYVEYKGFIPKSHYKVLVYSTILRNKFFRERKQIDEGRKRIYDTMGIEGIKIFNLSSAGYFDRDLKALLERHDDQARIFKKYYRRFVENDGYAVFVHANDAFSSQSIADKIDKNRRFGVEHVDLHGLGRKNVNKINEMLTELKENYSFTEEDIRPTWNVDEKALSIRLSSSGKTNDLFFEENTNRILSEN